MNLFQSILSSEVTVAHFAICTAVGVLCGILVALFYMYKNSYTKSMVSSIILLPAIVSLVIMMVNGNIGAGLVTAGTFQLIKFRSVKASARDLISVFLAMAGGLACGMGYVGIAVLFELIMCVAGVILFAINFKDNKDLDKTVKITIPENLDANFDDVFKKYTSKFEMSEVKTVDMGSLLRYTYNVSLNKQDDLLKLMNEIRSKNGNLEVSISRMTTAKEEL